MLLLALIWLRIASHGLAFGALLPGGLMPLPLRLLAGLAIETSLARALHLFLPLGGLAQLLFDAAALLLLFLHRRRLMEEWRAFRAVCPPALAAVLAVLALAVLQLSSTRSTLQDTGFYYLQCILWVQDFPAVPGVGNLFNRLANNSGWFTTCALHDPFFLRPAFALNGFVFVTAIAALLTQGWTRWRECRAAVVALFLAALASSSLPQWQLDSQNTDVPTALLLWLILVRFMAAPTDIPTRLALCILALWLPTLKLSTAPILILPAWELLRALRARATARAFALVGWGALLFLPWLVQGVISSGYLVYPVYQLDLCNFDWKMPAEVLQYESRIIKTWGRVPFGDPATVAAMPLSEWLPIWLLNQSLVNKALIVVAAAAALLVAWAAACRRLRLESSQWATLALAALGSAFCWAAAPDLRFAYGFLLVFIAIAFAVTATRCLQWRGAHRLLPWVICLLLTLHLGRSVMTGQGAWLRPHHDYPQSTRTITVNEVTVRTLPSPADAAREAEGGSPWHIWWRESHRYGLEDRTPPPAAPYVRFGLHSRGPRVEDGYRMKTANDAAMRRLTYDGRELPRDR
jgi:hypothetical protein